MQILVPAAMAALVAAMALAAGVTGPPAGSRPVPGIGAARTSVTGAPTGPVSDRVEPSGFGWPLSPRPTVHRRFEQPRSQWSPGHRGVDLVAAVGQPVLSAGEGVVAFSGVVAGRGVITVRHPDGLRTTYEPVDHRLPAGTRVHQSARIGVVSATGGHCLPLRCLHWGAITGHGYLDPLSLLGAGGRPILLPLR